jgi:hypothetical protein
MMPGGNPADIKHEAPLIVREGYDGWIHRMVLQSLADDQIVVDTDSCNMKLNDPGYRGSLAVPTAQPYENDRISGSKLRNPELFEKPSNCSALSLRKHCAAIPGPAISNVISVQQGLAVIDERALVDDAR